MKESPKLYYKLCYRTYSDVLTSCSAGGSHSYKFVGGYQPFIYDTIYFEPKDGRWSKPSVAGTKLFIFSDLAKALQFKSYGMAKDNDTAEVWECDAEGVVELKEDNKMIQGAGDCYNMELFEKFWNGSFPKDYFWKLTSVPGTTLWCDSLRLIKRVG